MKNEETVNVYLLCKKFKILYSFQEIGNTIIENKVRQEKSTKPFTYLFLIQKDFSFKDTKKFTVSLKLAYVPYREKHFLLHVFCQSVICCNS